MEYALTQQGKPSSAKPHAFQKLQFLDFSLDHSIAVRKRQTGKNSRFVPLDAADHPLEFADLAVSHMLQPGVKPFAFAMTKQAHKVLSQFIHGIGRETRLADGCKFCLLSLVQIGIITDEQPDCLVRGKLLEGRVWECLRMFSPALR